MSDHTDEHHHAEIVIVRRKHGDHDGHHGGAWKIAYADFVTAMMAFFLVMWLVNSANEATRAKVASYFNPIKMTDPSPAGKGLREVPNPKHTDTKAPPEVSGSAEKQGDAVEAKDGGKAEQANVSAQKSEDNMMHDPYKAIDSISTEGSGQPSGREVEIVSEKSGDPFDPKAWEALREGKKNSETSQAPALANNGAVMDHEPTSATKTAEEFPPQTSKVPVETSKDAPVAKTGENQIGQSAAGEQKAGDQKVGESAAGDQKAGDQKLGEQKSGENQVAATPVEKTQTAEVTPEQVTPPVAPTKDNPAQDTAAAQNQKVADTALVDQTAKAILEAAKVAGVSESLNISVKMTSEGLLIVLSDKVGSSMFDIGSAAPTQPLVAVVESIGKILNSQPGKVVVRGHTDARQYRSLKFDNWQLSTSRAHMASYMLLKGGLDEGRILKIEGFGATSPIENSDPLAPENRRVEFLLQR
ncbi:MotB family protein [Aestuariivirga litoralis]|uniref:MotB family protein n=1 Tax=Aestuariivirga litoralis TaxID=2650924 RepID=UPI0018C772BF|nr:MotB family protein [Aestuariivirga litoralis]MBG1233185.1 MotB family protein [Aestuariivirga litoralis]